MSQRLFEHIKQSEKFQAKKPPMTIEEANKEVGTRASVGFGVSLIKRLAEAQKKDKASEAAAQRNPSILNS